MTGPKQDVWCITLWGGLTLGCAVSFLVGALLIPSISLVSGPVDPKGPGMLVAAIGMPLFLFGQVFGIIALASNNSKSKKLAKTGLAILWMSFLVGIVLVAIFRDK